jgi:hypothetical protein
MGVRVWDEGESERRVVTARTGIERRNALPPGGPNGADERRDIIPLRKQADFPLVFRHEIVWQNDTGGRGR